MRVSRGKLLNISHTCDQLVLSPRRLLVTSSVAYVGSASLQSSLTIRVFQSITHEKESVKQ